jgi:hypothetical protein
MKKLLLLFMITNSTFAEDNKLIFKDNVKSMTDQDTARRIVLQKDPAIFYLKRDNKNFAVINAALEKSKTDHGTIQFKANATTMEIEELIVTKSNVIKKNLK